MSANALQSAVDLLSDAMRPTEPSFTTEFANQVLSLKLPAEAAERIRDLLYKNNAGTLTPEEQELLDGYLMVGEFMNLMKAKARVTLLENAKSA
jgi:hypothetical protein